MPSIVSEVSAIFVHTIIFLPAIPLLFGAGGESNIFYYILGGSEEYRGMTLIYFK
jgi:hypothetical protein